MLKYNINCFVFNFLFNTDMQQTLFYLTAVTVNAKVKLSLYLKHHAMKTYGGMEVYLLIFLSCTLNGDE
jgi:hypothetical protein